MHFIWVNRVNRQSLNIFDELFCKYSLRALCGELKIKNTDLAVGFMSHILLLKNKKINLKKKH